MKKKWRIYPRGGVFWIAFTLLMIVFAFFISGIIIVGYTKEDLFLEIILSVILFSVIIGFIIWFLLSNISIDENNCLKMPFFCRNLMPFESKKKEKIILKYNLIDVHLMHTHVYVYMGFEDKNGKVTLINVTMFSKKQQAVLQHKLEEYKIEQN